MDIQDAVPYSFMNSYTSKDQDHDYMQKSLITPKAKTFDFEKNTDNQELRNTETKVPSIPLEKLDKNLESQSKLSKRETPRLSDA